MALLDHHAQSVAAKYDRSARSDLIDEFYERSDFLNGGY